MIRQVPNKVREMWEPPVRHHRLRAVLAPARKARAMWEPPVRHHPLRAALAPAHNAERAMWEPPVRHHPLRAALAPAHNAARPIWELLARHHRRSEICRIGATPVAPEYFNKFAAEEKVMAKPTKEENNTLHPKRGAFPTPRNVLDEATPYRPEPPDESGVTVEQPSSGSDTSGTAEEFRKQPDRGSGKKRS